MDKLTEFRNEPYVDFSVPATCRAMEEALQQVHGEFGREYQLRIGSEWIATNDQLQSLNPSKKSEVVGVHHKASADLARRAVDSAWSYFPQWSRTPAEQRVRMVVDGARKV